MSFAINVPSTLTGWLGLLVDHPSVYALGTAHAIYVAHKLKTTQGSAGYRMPLAPPPPCN